MSAVGEEFPSFVALDGRVNNAAEEGDGKVVRDSVNGLGADLGANSGTSTARNTSGLTCAAAAGRRRVPRTPLRLQDASNYQHWEKEPGVG
eukprot:7736560-Pyramimonas_sp.AAC.1